MIVSAYGVPGITCVELALMFNDLGINYGLVRQHQKFTKVQNTTKPNQPVYPVVFSSVPTFLRTQGKFKAQKVVAFVVDNPVSLTKNVSPVLPMIGAVTVKTFTTYTKITQEELKKALKASVNLDTPIVFSSKKFKPVDEILKKYEQSDLSVLQTFLYKIKDTDVRDKVSLLTKDWLLTSAPYAKIEGRLHKQLKPGIAETLRQMLTTSSVENLRKAIRQVKQHKLTIGKAAKAYKVSAFDIRYLMSSHSPTTPTK